MKVRHLKRITLFTMAFNNWERWAHDDLHRTIMMATPSVVAGGTNPVLNTDGYKVSLPPAMEVTTFFDHTVPAKEHSVELAKQEFVVVKKNGGEVVDTFDSKDDALALIEKHKKQKKAALVLLDTIEATA